MRLSRQTIGLATAILLFVPGAAVAGGLAQGEPTDAAPGPGTDALLACYASAVPTGPSAECPEVARVDVQGETYYVSAYGVYREDNGCEGLQTLPSDCNSDGVVEPRDNWQNLYDVAGGLPYYQEGYDILFAIYSDGVFRVRCLAHEVYGESLEAPEECESVILPPSAAPPSLPVGEGIACIEGAYLPDGDEAASCPEIASADVNGERYYLAADWVYRESNGCDGVQTQPGDCDGDGSPEGTDDFYSVRDIATGALPQLHDAFDALIPLIDIGFMVIDLGFDTAYAMVDVSSCILLWQIGTPNAEEACEGATQTIDTPTGTTYVQPQPFRIFVEGNGCDGLQRAPSDCDGDGEEEAADPEVGVLLV